MKEYLRRKDPRDYMLFLLGIHTGLRISDLLNLRVEKCFGSPRITLKEKKTGKSKSLVLPLKVQKELLEYLQDREEGWLFPSKKKDNQSPISRQAAYEILNQAGKEVGIQESVGTHTLRKTFAYWAYKRGSSLVLMQKILNHSSPSTTLRYIGITQEEIDNVYRRLKFK